MDIVIKLWNGDNRKINTDDYFFQKAFLGNDFILRHKTQQYIGYELKAGMYKGINNMEELIIKSDMLHLKPDVILL